MFQTLDATWDRSARRGWSALASFTMQALALSLLLAIPLVWIQGPPQLRWIDASIFSPPPAQAPTPPPQQQVAHRPIEGSEVRGTQIVMPGSVPSTITTIVDAPIAPSIGDTGFQNGIGTARQGVWQSVRDTVAAVAPPPKPAASAKPPRVSEFEEGNPVHRVQPQYPQIARMAGIQGQVHLRAIVSKSGTIENLTVIDGHSMLIQAAVEAVRHWRYRPYMLNGEPIAVETEITVNFTLGR